MAVVTQENLDLKKIHNNSESTAVCQMRMKINL